MHRPFTVEFDLASPLIMDRGIGLPGLLARLIADAGEADPLALVPLARTEGIFAGSDLFTLGPTLTYHVAYVRSLRPAAMPHDLALWNTRRKRPLDQITLRDEFKNLLDAREATSAMTLVAFGCGVPGQVEALLRGLGQLGAKRGGGYGVVTEVRVSQFDHPHAGFADRDGSPLRAVPVALWRRMNLPPRPVRSLVAGLPRWSSPREPCVGPREWTMEPAAFAREVEP